MTTQWQFGTLLIHKKARLFYLSPFSTVSLLLLFAAGCEDTPVETVTPPTLHCDPDAPSFLLKSKLDDDDGDGNPYDEDFPLIDDEDDDIADHMWINDNNGLYHLFFQNEGQWGPSEIEHYTSTDLRSLDYVGLALRAILGNWDSGGLWAPYIVKNGDTYFMFYTGTTGPGVDPATVQAIGLATSPDLMTWTRYPAGNCPGTSGDGCVYQCDEDWTMWGGPPGSYNQQCRDPFVIWDSSNGRWIMFAVAKSTNQYGVVTVSYSPNMTEWTGAGFIDATRRLATGEIAQTTGGQAENPHVMTYENTRYLLFTDWHDAEDSVSVQNPRTIVQYATSPALTADTLGSTNWTYRGYTPDPAVNAIEVFRLDNGTWIMSQSIANQRSGFWSQRRSLRLKCIFWGDDFSFETSNVTFR